MDQAVEPVERLAHLDLVPDDLGDKKLRKLADGACVHLGPQGCTVYEHRPKVCRSHDCRAMGFFALAIDYRNGHCEPARKFTVASAEDKEIKAAIHYLLMLYRAKNGEPFDAVKVAGYVKANLAVTTQRTRDAFQMRATMQEAA